MPVFEYRCKMGHKAQVLVGMTSAKDEAPTLCATCQSIGIRSEMTRTVSQFKKGPSTVAYDPTDPRQVNARQRADAWFRENEARMKDNGYEADTEDPYCDNDDGDEVSSSVLSRLETDSLNSVAPEKPANPIEAAEWQKDRDRDAKEAAKNDVDVSTVTPDNGFRVLSQGDVVTQAFAKQIKVAS